jgi:hypothetical protein
VTFERARKSSMRRVPMLKPIVSSFSFTEVHESWSAASVTSWGFVSGVGCLGYEGSVCMDEELRVDFVAHRILFFSISTIWIDSLDSSYFLDNFT